MNNNLKILYDAYFKYIFNKRFGIMYMSRIISTLFDLDYDDLVNNILIASTEHVRSKSIKSSFSDVIYMYKNKRFIIEMNNSYTSEIVYKNHFYLFYHHIFDLENKNSYNSNIETYLIDIDNFDILDKLHKKDMKHEFIYQSRLILDNTLYSLYPNIRAVRINLDYLKKKQYNYGMLSDIERSCLIFTTNDLNVLRKETKVENIEGVIKMFKMVYENGEIYPVFDEEKFHEAEKRDMYRQGEEDGIEKGIEQGIEQGSVNEKISIAKILRKKNFTDKDIMEITGITKSQIKSI